MWFPYSICNDVDVSSVFRNEIQSNLNDLIIKFGITVDSFLVAQNVI